ncbi:TAXI family TRAP transporter solute-binding subunit [Kribbella sp. NPDC051952]|uniref:TAXI family TRAP transporter solute-binding subunit n=1 Tax=Kribbella sp. NPDC051952 TaxID=3154851 RepID=UPI00343E504A
MTDQISALTWLGGNPGDGWYEMTERLVDLLNGQESSVKLTLAAGGGEQNLTKIQDGEAELGMSIDVVVNAAVNGGPPFDAPMPRLASLGTGWSALPYNLLRSPSAAEFGAAITGGGLRIGVPPRDTTDELMFQHVVAYYGTTYEEIATRGGQVLLADYDALIAALTTGTIDYVFGATTLPAPSIASAADGRRKVELAPLPADLIEHLVRRYACSRGVIPAGTYPGLHDADIATCFAQTVFVVSADVPETAAYDLTRLLVMNTTALAEVHPSLAGFNPFAAWRNGPAPIHPGAARAYRELGCMD